MILAKRLNRSAHLLHSSVVESRFQRPKVKEKRFRLHNGYSSPPFANQRRIQDF
jgi:hypothetical protein